MTPAHLGLLTLALLSAVIAADPSVRLDLVQRRTASCPGWLGWPVPGGDGSGPLTRRVPASLVDPDGFSVTLGPAGALGLRGGGECSGDAAAALRESVFTPAERPMELTFSGLRSGPYQLALWLNDARGHVWPPVRIEVTDANGVGRVVAEGQPQTATTDSGQAARALVGIQARDGSEVLVRLLIPPAPKTYVFLSALEVIRPGEPEAALLTELATPRAPRPGLGAADVSPDATLAWADSLAEVRWDLWVGPTADALQPVATGLRQPAWAGRFEPGTTVFWRVEGCLGDRRVPGPLWRFGCGDAIPLEDFEGYHPGLRLSDTWDDGRAGAPGRGPLIALTADGRNSLVIRHPGGEVVLRRALADHPDWSVGGMTHLTACWRGPATAAQPVFRIRLTDDAGQSCVMPPATHGSGRPGGWTSLAATLADAGAVHLATLREMALIVTMPAPGELMIDDLRLERPGRPASPVPACLRTGRLDTLRGAPPAPAAGSADEACLRTDVCVVGGGSGGIGAALAAARAGVRVVLLEREAILGGTSTAGGISNWEPGPGCDLAREIFERLRQRAEGVLCGKPAYQATLTRAGRGNIQFEPEVFHSVVAGMLSATGRCRVLLDTMATEATVDVEAKRVVAVRAVSRDGSRWCVRAGTFIDCTGGAFLCQAAGCDIMLGAEPRSQFGEPSAPETASDRLNALELVYRIRPATTPQRQELPKGQKPRPGGAAWPLPSGDRFVNSCGGLASGQLLLERGYAQARADLEQRALAHWHWLQATSCPDYEFDSFYPMLAVRESHRVVGEYVLREHDLTAGLAEQKLPDIIALADHPMDTHGAGGGLKPVAAPYGIPFRCLVPRGGWRNLLVACRGASFSHVAASSCRLSRTMLALGHAAGLAAAQCAERGVDVPAVDVRAIQQQLGMPAQK